MKRSAKDCWVALERAVTEFDEAYDTIGRIVQQWRAAGDDNIAIALRPEYQAALESIRRTSERVHEARNNFELAQAQEAGAARG